MPSDMQNDIQVAILNYVVCLKPLYLNGLA